MPAPLLRMVVVLLLAAASAATAATRQPLLALRLHAPGGELELVISGEQMMDRRLTISCRDTCAMNTYQEPFPDGPVTVLMVNDAATEFCVLASTGSAMALHCYTVGAQLQKLGRTGTRGIVSVTQDGIHYLDGERREQFLPWRGTPPRAAPPSPQR